MDTNKDTSVERFSRGLLLFIILCVVCLASAIIIALTTDIETQTKQRLTQPITIPYL